MTLNDYLAIPIEIENELNQYLQRDSALTIFEIGSCESEDSIKYSRFFPNSKIFAFEPMPNNFIKGKKNLQEHNISNVELHELAMSNIVGESEFYMSSGHPEGIEKTENWDYGNKSSSLLPSGELAQRYAWIDLNQKITVKTNTIFDFCEEHNIAKIDFIHMDVQGAELMVLEGTKTLLNNIKIIWLEVESVELYKGQPLKGTIIEFLKKNNFTIIKDTCQDVSGDILCINNSQI